MSRTRIVILQMRELIYTAIFVGLGILLLILLFVMFWPGKGGKSDHAANTSQVEQKYEAGVYTKEITLGDASVNIQLSLDEDSVKSVELVNLEESVSTMYPLMQPTVEKMSKELAAANTMDEIVVSEESQYTEKIIANAVSEMLQEHRK